MHLRLKLAQCNVFFCLWRTKTGTGSLEVCYSCECCFLFPLSSKSSFFTTESTSRMQGAAERDWNMKESHTVQRQMRSSERQALATPTQLHAQQQHSSWRAQYLSPGLCTPCLPSCVWILEVWKRIVSFNGMFVHRCHVSPTQNFQQDYVPFQVFSFILGHNKENMSRIPRKWERISVL